MTSKRVLMLFTLLVALATLSGCGRRQSLLEPDRRAVKEVRAFGNEEAIARAQDRATQQKSADAYTLLAHIFALASRGREAREALDSALKIDPTFPPAAVMKAQLLLSEGKAADAEKLVRPVLAKHPDVVEAYELLGRALRRLNRSAEAVTVLQDAVKKHGREATLYWALGDALDDCKQYAEAKKVFLRALRLDRKTAELRLAYAQVLLDSGDKAQAAKLALEGVKLRPDSPQVRFVAGTHLYNAGRAQEAVAQYKESLVLDPGNPAAANNLALILADMQVDTTTAVSWARKAAVAVPRSLAVGDTLGWALARDGQYKEALELLNRVHKLWPDNSAVQYHLGWTLAKTGKRAEGLALVQKAAASKREDIAPLAQKALAELSR